MAKVRSLPDMTLIVLSACLTKWRTEQMERAIDTEYFDLRAMSAIIRHGTGDLTRKEGGKEGGKLHFNCHVSREEEGGSSERGNHNPRTLSMQRSHQGDSKQALRASGTRFSSSRRQH